MSDVERGNRDEGGTGEEQRYAAAENPADANEHRHGSVVHSHEHIGPHEHGDDYEYDEAHDPDMPKPRGGQG